MSGPELRGTRPPGARGVVLLLHGGGEVGRREMTWRSSAVLRMRPFAAAIERAGRGALAVVRLKNAVFGWNDDETSPVHDARWALDVVRREEPGLPIALVGHSMGGRVALRLAGDEGVTALVGLAPWVHPSDDPHGGPGLSALLLHGSLDRTTDPRATERMAGEMRARGADATYRRVKSSGHAMVLRAPLWHRETATFVRDALLGPDRTS